MYMFSLKRIFDREREIRRLRKSYASLEREWLATHLVQGKHDDNYVYVSWNGGLTYKTYLQVM